MAAIKSKDSDRSVEEYVKEMRELTASVKQHNERIKTLKKERAQDAPPSRAGDSE